MLQCTEQEYAMKFWMLAMLDKRAVSGMNRYADNFKYILESYSRSLKASPGLMLSDSSLDMDQGECRKLAGDLAKLCTRGEINHVLMQGVSDQSQLFYVLVEALYRTMILVRFYAPDGELTEKILKETYCTSMQKSDIELCSRLSISRTTYYRKKKSSILYAGYFFYEAVLPEMEGLLWNKTKGET